MKGKEKAKGGEKRKLDRKRKGEEEENKGKEKGDFLGVSMVESLDGPKVKVDPRNEGYPWVPKSWSFIILQGVYNFPTWVISSLKVI